jgi:hypothetical protein
VQSNPSKEGGWSQTKITFAARPCNLGESMENFLIEIFVKAFAKVSVTALVKAAVSWIKRRTAPGSRDSSDATDNK